jgi:hypothetical protein
MKDQVTDIAFIPESNTLLAVIDGKIAKLYHEGEMEEKNAYIAALESKVARLEASLTKKLDEEWGKPLKIGDTLIAIDPCRMDDLTDSLTVWKEYKITDLNLEDNSLEIIDDSYTNHVFDITGEDPYTDYFKLKA